MSKGKLRVPRIEVSSPPKVTKFNYGDTKFQPILSSPCSWKILCSLCQIVWATLLGYFQKLATPLSWLLMRKIEVSCPLLFETFILGFQALGRGPPHLRSPNIILGCMVQSKPNKILFMGHTNLFYII